MKEYRIIWSSGSEIVPIMDQIMAEVNAAFAEGWKLYGPLIVCSQPPTTDYPEPFFDVFREMIHAPETVEFRRSKGD